VRVLNGLLFFVALPACFGFGLLINAPLVRAQSPAIPKWEVVSIKPCKVDLAQGARGPVGGSFARPSPGRLEEVCRPLLALVRNAYILFANARSNPGLNRSTGLEGAPDWINDRYDIQAKTEAMPPPTAEMMQGPMLQTLLENRFQLHVHFEARQVPVYELTIAKGGIKFQFHREGTCVPLASGNVETPQRGIAPPTLLPGEKRCANNSVTKGDRVVVEMQRVTIDTLADLTLRGAYVRGTLDRPVINKTGLSGLFDIHMEYSNDAADAPSIVPSDAPNAPSLFTALEDIGLKLQPAKGPGEFLIIDHVERPSEGGRKR
jgi:uncharacterized protein (TIGR03435 family)